MKKLLSIILICLTLCFCGCGANGLEYSAIVQDSYHTGGNLSFSYDQYTHTAYFGGEGEFVEFYQTDIAKGWSEEGNRIGFKIFLPQEVDDYMSATAVLNDEEMEYSSFIMGDEIKYALFQPLVNKDNSILTLKIKWEDGAIWQTYQIVIKEGTRFLEK